jgi:hypothetical protein
MKLDENDSLGKGFPSIVNADFEKDFNAIPKRIADFVIERHLTSSKRRQEITETYKSYNRTEIDDDFKKNIGYLLNPYGQGEIKVPFKKFLLARSKVNRLRGEFLELPLKATVACSNPETIRKKVMEMRQIKGISILKNELEHIRSMGIPVFKGMQIVPPEANPINQTGKFQTKAEVLNQTVLNKKMDEQKIKISLLDNVVDMILVSECHGKVEIGLNGKSQYRPIDADNSIFMEMDKDPFTQRSIAWGECQKMMFHEVVLNFNLSKEDQRKISASITEGLWNASDYSQADNDITINVYTIETYRVVPVVTKVSKSGSSLVPYRSELTYDYYIENKKDLDKQELKGKISIEVHYIDEPWEIVRIGSDFYPVVRKKIDPIITSRDGGYVTFFSDYVNYLSVGKKGKRVSIWDLMEKIDETYDIVRWKVNNEISGYIGSVRHYDEAYLPKGKDVVSMMQSIVQDRMVTTNSSEEGNKAEFDGKNIGFQEIQFGDASHILNLIYVGNSLEATMDELVGFTKPRTGQTNAGTTNANAQIDLAASKVATYDVFFSVSEYIEEVLIRFLEKARMNIKNESFGQNGMIFDSDDAEFMQMTKDMLLEEMGIKLTDGRREGMIKEMIQSLAVNDISQGKLRSSDVADFMLTDTLAAGINVLREAWAEITSIGIQQQQMDLQSKGQMSQAQIQAMKEDREDKQAHELNKVVLTEGLKKQTMIDGAQLQAYFDQQMAGLNALLGAAGQQDMAMQQQAGPQASPQQNM